jgi:lactate permease
MSNYWIFLSILPLSIFCLLLLFKKISLLKVSLITFLVTLFLVLFFWQMSPLFVFQLSLKGILVAFDIFLIIFGAILFLDILKKGNIIASLTFFLEKISPDFRIQVIILAWFFENFLEGIAGFGTPSTVVAPILVALGLSPMTSAVIALLGNSTSTPFGAVGTPIRVGFAGVNINFASISTTTALINFIGILVPVFMLYFLVFKKPNKKQLFFETLPFALWSGIAFVIPSFIISLFGFEFPSIIGSIVGLILVLITNHFKIFVPKNIIKSEIYLKS